jgi:hypothetical protein
LAIAGPSGATTSSGNPAIASADDDKFYDNIYFDSDDEDDSQEMEGTGCQCIFFVIHSTLFAQPFCACQNTTFYLLPSFA